MSHSRHRSRARSMRAAGATIRDIAEMLDIPTATARTLVEHTPTPTIDRHRPKPCRCEEPIVFQDWDDIRCFTCGRETKG